MKISGISNIQSVMKAYNKTKMQTINKSYQKEDKIEISDAGKYYQIAMKAIKDIPDVRDEKVEKIKMQIESGNYTVDIENLAKAIINNKI
ncbi:anti-sigma-28 factor, FlgM family [Alkalithermobacter thermoalcaliphilus JW-YL-7 = DSM 7308]|uniref:Negative regulator of flagellin synthesis n=1 Tax=Alkalithermobacter thermoalcaliphilus JW-YL-7 = DSM 7308 TaxID=1121328 RepID=A0A150FNA0_CLOPD|nr:flagellar biosynthesis anti-sigma factor protein FlgM [[Clostridium] paradoxum JW-YL-7 = DSM 7308]SHL05739.1 anti-sigma-28 factor, FlgM family [[Clostridium] paradoxum JW-YL-7 = DSM 7308]